MPKINIQHHKTKIGELILGSFEGKLCLLDFFNREKRNTIDNRLKKGLKTEFVAKDNEILQETKKQIDQYLAGERKEFDLPLIMVGSDFQKQVWRELLKLKYGETASYLELAKKINNEKAVRAVASANGANAMGLIIPCHRVIASNGGIGGYAGGITAKEKLLELEK